MLCVSLYHCERRKGRTFSEVKNCVLLKQEHCCVYRVAQVEKGCGGWACVRLTVVVWFGVARVRRQIRFSQQWRPFLCTSHEGLPHSAVWFVGMQAGLHSLFIPAEFPFSRER